ncbi:MAG: OmpA family protein [Candidatus Rokuibacteriota bacterium]
MKVQFQIVALSALAIAVGLTGCDSGPRAPKIQATQEQPGGTSAAANTPPSETASVSEPEAVGDLKNVHFELDQAKIRSGDARILQDHARWLKSRRDTTVMIGGHADERGSDEHNMRLGERRANAVRGYLIAQGVDADRVATTTHGEHSPACSDHTESCWGKNRRAEFQVKAR